MPRLVHIALYRARATDASVSVAYQALVDALLPRRVFGSALGVRFGQRPNELEDITGCASHSGVETLERVAFDKVELKVVHGRTDSDLSLERVFW